MRDVNEVIRHRSELEERVDDLRKFERSYRTRLQVFFEGQLRELYAPDMRQQAEERIRELQEDTVRRGYRPSKRAAPAPGRHIRSAAARPRATATTANTDEGLSDHDTEE